MAEIRSAAAFNEAVAKCVGGETLTIIEPIEAVAIWKRRFASPLTIECAERGEIRMAPRDSTASYGGAWNSAFGLVECDNILLRNLRCRGVALPNPRAGEPGEPKAIHLGGSLGMNRSTRIKVEGGWYGDGYIGIGGEQLREVEIDRVDVTNIGNFGIQIGGGGTENVTVRRSRVTDFDLNLARGDHPDGIMFHTSPDLPQCHANVLVEDNLVQGNGPNQPQGIFFRDAAGWLAGAQPNPFRNITVRRNVLLNCMWAFIAWERVADGIVIVDNELGLVMLDPAEFPGLPQADPAKRIREARIIGDRAPREVSGNAATVYAWEGLARGACPAGNAINGPLSWAEVRQRAEAWAAKHRPAGAPAPTPAPSPRPSPAPSAILESAKKARLEVNEAENGLGRARYALDQALRSLDAGRVSKARLEVNTAGNTLGRALYALDKILAGLGG